MTNETTSIPKWITIYLWFTAILTIAFSLMGYFKPEGLFATWPALATAGTLSLAGPVGLFVARNLGTAAVNIFALLQKNASMIKLVLLLRMVTDGFDCINNLIAGNMPIAIFGGVMCLIEIFAFTKVKA